MKKPDVIHPAERVYRKYPAFAETMRTRTARYNACRAELFEREADRDAEQKVMVIAPEDTLGCSRTERNLKVIRSLWQEGYFDGLRAAGQVRAFWGG